MSLLFTYTALNRQLSGKHSQHYFYLRHVTALHKQAAALNSQLSDKNHSPLLADSPVHSSKNQPKQASEVDPDGVVVRVTPVFPGVTLQQQPELFHQATAVPGLELQRTAFGGGLLQVLHQVLCLSANQTSAVSNCW